MENIILVGSLVGLEVFITNSIFNSNYFTKLQKITLIFLIILPPIQWLLTFLFWLFNRSKGNLIAFNIDKSNSHIKDLKKLKDKNILNQEEYDLKTKDLKNSLKKEFLQNLDEYKSLLNLKNNGILSNTEFEKKVQFLYNKIDSIDQIEKNKLNTHKKNETKSTFQNNGFSISNNIIYTIIILCLVALIIMFLI